MKKVTALGALGLAAALLGLQVILGLEYTAGGTLGTQVGMVLAMVTLAALPVAIHAAWHYRLPFLSVSLVVPFVAFLIYSLPATTGRTGEIKETKVAAANDVALWKSELASLTKQLNWHREQKNVECVSAPVPLPANGWPKCRSHTAAVTSYEERIEKLDGKVAKAGTPTGDLGSDLWAWATGADAATVRKVSVLAFAIGMDFAIWALIWLATSLLTAPVRSANDNGFRAMDHIDPLPPVRATVPEVKGTNVIAWSRAFEQANGRKPRLDEAELAFKGQPVSRSTIYRRLKAA